ncbi:MAG TPA: zf-HC2 domain-containing protein [Terriglobia bacterium]|nr:zf-HC2 domain-containing protein [Terriglobia bacterium]
MICREIQDRFSARIDHELAQVEEFEIRQHLEVCPFCSTVYQDLLYIRKSAKELELVSPPDRLWKSLSAQMKAEGLIRKPRSFWERVFAVDFGSSLKPALTGAIVTLILVAASSFLVTKFSHRQPEMPASSDAQVLQEVRDAESHYQKAIEALSESSRERLETLDPAVAEIFNDNLATMDYYLKECKEAALTDPDNPLVHHYLLTAYQKKVELLETIVNSDSL